LILGPDLIVLETRLEQHNMKRDFKAEMASTMTGWDHPDSAPVNDTVLYRLLALSNRSAEAGVASTEDQVGAAFRLPGAA
jgi:hypothetical protein